MRWITSEGDLPGTSGGGDGWHPTSHATPLFSQMGQSSKTFNPSSRKTSMVTLHAECGVDDLIGGERGNSGPVVDMMNYLFL